MSITASVQRGLVGLGSAEKISYGAGIGAGALFSDCGRGARTALEHEKCRIQRF
jgi:hypothetical protein